MQNFKSTVKYSIQNVLACIFSVTPAIMRASSYKIIGSEKVICQSLIKMEIHDVNEMSTYIWFCDKLSSAFVTIKEWLIGHETKQIKFSISNYESVLAKRIYGSSHLFLSMIKITQLAYKVISFFFVSINWVVTKTFVSSHCVVGSIRNFNQIVKVPLFKHWQRLNSLSSKR